MADIQVLTVPAILIENVDRTRMTRATGSFRIEYQLGARGRADIEIRDVSSLGTAYRPGIDQTVRINPNLFSGALFNVADSPIVPPHVGTLTRFQAMDNWRFAARRRVFEQFPAGTYDLFNFVVYIVGKYLAPYGITVDGSSFPNNGPVLGELVFDYSTVEDVFNRLAVLTSWIYRLTPANAVQWFPVGAMLRPFTFSAANKNIIGAVQWTQTQGTFANRIILRYGTGLVERTESFVGDGVRRSWPLTYPLAEVGWVRYPGVLDQESRTQTWPGEGAPSSIAGGVEFYTTDYPALQDYQNTWPDAATLHSPDYGFPVWWGPLYAGGVDWWWDPLNHSLCHYQSFPYDSSNPGLGNITPASRTVTIAPYLALDKDGVGTEVSSLWRWHYDAATNSLVNDLPHPIRAGLEFTFDYKVQFPLVVIVEDAADIAINGISEDLREEPQIFEQQAATDFANGLLRKQKRTPRTAHLATRVASDFLPGDTVQLDIPSRTLPASSWLVTSVILSADVDQKLTTQLELLEGSEAQGSWVDFWRNMLGTGSGSGQGIASGSVIPGTGTVPPGTVTMFLPATTNRLTKWASPTVITDSLAMESTGGITVDGSLVTSGTDPAFGLIDTDSGVDQRIWVWTTVGVPGVLELQARNDANAVVTSIIRVTRVGVATFTGIPIAPTAAPGTNNTQLATTAFVRSALATLPAGAHAPTHQPGGSDPLTALSASILITGALPFARINLSGPGRLLGSTNEVPGGGPMVEITLGTGLVMQATQLMVGAHKTTHQVGGIDVVDVKLLGGYPGGTTTFLRGDGAFAAAFGAHKTTHQVGGTDIVDVKLLGGYPGDSAIFLRGDGTFAAPPGGTIPGAHHATHEPGGGDALVGAAWTTVANVFTQDQQISKAGQARLVLTDTTQAVNSKTWQIANAGSKFIVVSGPDGGGQGGTQYLTLEQPSGKLTLSQLWVTSGADIFGLVTINAIAGQIPTLKLNAQTPVVQITATTGAVDAKTWRVWVGTTGAGQLNFDCVNDAVSAVQSTPLYLTRPGDAYFAGKMYERGRTTYAMGQRQSWTPLIYTAEGAAVTPGSIQALYFVIGDVLFWTVYLVNWNNPAAGTAYLRFTVPAPFVPAVGDQENNPIRIYVPGIGDAIGWTNANASGGYPGFIQVYRPGATWPAGVGHIIGQGRYFIA